MPQVIRNAQRIKTILYNNETYEAELVGTEPDKDLAVLKLKGSASAFQPLAVGSSQGLLVGQKTFAIGAPFGLDQTLTAGIVSGLGREVRGITGPPPLAFTSIDRKHLPGWSTKQQASQQWLGTVSSHEMAVF